MTIQEQQAFAYGMLLGAALAVQEQLQEFAALELRVRHLEQRRRFRTFGRLIPAGQREGRQLYHVAEWAR